MATHNTIKINNRSRFEQGFTLIELLIVLAIISIIVVIGIPNLSMLLDRSRLSSASDSMFITFLTARSQAIKSQTRVVVCPSTDGVYCDTNSSPAWNKYQIVYQESSDTGFTRQDSEALLRTVKSPRGEFLITSNPTADTAFAYLQTGEIRGNNSTTNVEFTISDNETTTPKAYKITIARNGSITTNSYFVSP